MKNLFVIFAKLLGVYFIFRFFENITVIGRIISRDSIDAGFIIGYICIILLIILLLFKTGFLANILGIGIKKSENSLLSATNTLKIGLLLIAIYFLIADIPYIIAQILSYIQGEEMVLRRLYLVIFRIPLAICVICFSSHIAQKLSPTNKI